MGNVFDKRVLSPAKCFEAAQSADPRLDLSGIVFLSVRRWNMTDQANFGKFVRFFTARLVQTLVQARLGGNVDQPCCPHPEQTDWFNTKIDELGEISAYLKSAVTEYPPTCQQLSIEFLLCTAEGAYLPLEAWVVSVEDGVDEDVNIASDLYHQMGTLLRSSALAARVTPMFRYFVKKQGQDTFVILYRVFEGKSLTDFGEKAKHLTMGQLPSPCGTICLDLIYRTDMTLPQAKATVSASKPVTPLSPPESFPCRPSFSDCIPISAKSENVTPDELSIPEDQEAPSPVRTQFRIGRSSSSEDSQSASSLQDNSDWIVSPVKPSFPLPTRKATRTLSFPFASLLESTEESRRRTNSETAPPPISILDLAAQQKSASDSDDEEDFSVDNEVDFNDDDAHMACGFMTKSSPEQELGAFIRDCRVASSDLSSFPSSPIDNIQAELNNFSSMQQTFDEFVSSVASTPD